MKLFTKYNQINLMVMALLFALAGVVYYVLIRKVIVDELDEVLRKYERHVEIYVLKNGSLPIFKNFEEVQVDYQLTDSRQSVKINEIDLYNIDDRKVETFRQIVFTQPVKDKFYLITVAKPLEGANLLIRTIVYSTLAILLILIVASILLNYLVLKKLWQPFYATMRKLRDFKLDNPEQPDLPETDIEEFSLMNIGLTKAMTGAKNDYRILKEFTENASHETQTPLAIIRSKLDLVIQDESLSENQSEALRSAYAAVTRLSKLNQSLLFLAKIENHQFAETVKINLKDRVQEKICQFNEFWEGNKIGINSVLEPSIIEANSELIDVLLNNLLSNAGRHNVEGGEIDIQLTQGKFVISNTAKLASLDKKRLFKRFYKESAYSVYNGLGLSIVKQIVDHSGMNISYEFSNQKHWFTFRW
jgi:signal transduction histidine kinase